MMIQQVTENIYVGSAEGARQKSEEYNKIVSVATPIKDSDYQSLISDGEHDKEKFFNAVDKVIELVNQDYTVLVHCQAGMSRSVTVATAAAVCTTELSFNEAIQQARRGFQYPAPQLVDSAKKYVNKNC